MSNYLLDLLNHSGAQSSASPSSAPAPASTSSTTAQWPQSSNGNASPSQQQDMGSAQSGHKSAVTSPQPSSSSSTTAASFLQTLLTAPLSPGVAKTQQQQQPAISDARSPSAHHSNPAAAASAASGLLALLSGPPPPTSTSPQKAAAEQATLESGDVALGPAAAEESKSEEQPFVAVPPKPLFSNQSLFDDLLAPSSPSSLTDTRTVGNGQHSDRKSTNPAEPQSSSPPPPHPGSGYLSQQSQPEPALVSAESEAEKEIVETANPAPVPAVKAAGENPEPAKTPKQTSQQSSGQPVAKPSLAPASKHVATLRETKAFASSHTSGLTTRKSSEVTTLELDLTAPQPGGESSLCPAKVEIERVAALDFPLHNSVIKVQSSNPSDNHQLVAEVPAPQVTNLGNNIIAYAMKKGRVRVLDCITGDRLLLQAEGGGAIQSINASPQMGGDPAESSWLLSAISQPRSAAEQTLSIWSITQHDARLGSEPLQTDDLAQELRKHGLLLSCDWSQREVHGEIPALVSSGGPSMQTPTGAFVRVNLSKKTCKLHHVIPKGSVDDSKTDSQVVASTLSADGRLAAFLARTADDGSLELVIRSDDGNSTSAPFSDLASAIQSNHSPSAMGVSFMEFVGPPADDSQGTDCPRALLVGFQSNAILGLYDLQGRAWRFVWKFDGASPGSAFNVVRFHRQGSSILVANSARASVMTIELKFDPFPQQSGDMTRDSTSMIDRLKSRMLPWTVQAAPSVSEAALSEPIISFAVAGGKRSGPSNTVKLFASFSSGTATVSIPFSPSQGNFLSCSLAPTLPPVGGSKPAGVHMTSSDSDGADPVAPSKRQTTASGLQGLLSSDSDLDVARTALKPQPSRFSVREKETPAEWDADTHSFSQLVSSGTTSGRNSPAPVRAAQTASSLASNSSPRTVTAKGRSKAGQTSSEAKRGAAAGSPRPREASHKETAQPKTILSRSAPVESNHDAVDGGYAAMLETLRNIDTRLTRMASDPAKTSTGTPSASSSQLSAAALSAIASEVGELVSSEIGSSVTPQILDAVRKVAEQSLREALSKDLRGALPAELKKTLGRSDVSEILTDSIMNGVIPVLQKTAMDVVSRVLAPHFEEAIAGLSQSFENQVKSSMKELREGVMAEQSAASTATQQQLEKVTATLSGVLESVGALARQNEALNASLKELKASDARRGNGAVDLPLALPPRPPPTPGPMQYGHHHHYGYNAPSQPRYPNGPWHPVEPFHSPMMSHQHLPHRPSTSQRMLPPFGGSTTPLSGYPLGAGPPPPSSMAAPAYTQGPPTPSVAEPQQFSVEDRLLSALTMADKSEADVEVQLSSLLAGLGAQYNRPDLALQAGSAGGTAINQAVLLTLLHRLATALSSQRGIISLETAVPWAEAAMALLKVDDATIAPAYAHVSDYIREAFLSAWQHAQASGRVPWWTEDRLHTYLLRHLK